MGQRHQIYVVHKQKNKFTALGAFHHQWCYGMAAVTNLTRAAKLFEANIIEDGEWQEYCSGRDPREVETVIKACYGVSLSGRISMVHNETEYLADAETGFIKPECGDNNDGCGLILIDDDEQKIKVGMFTPGHMEGQHWSGKPNRAYTRQEYLAFYYTQAEQNEPKFLASFEHEIKLLESGLLNPISQVELDACCGRKPKAPPKPRKTKTPKDIAGTYTGRTGLKVVINTDIPTELSTPKAKAKPLSPLEKYNARMKNLGVK